MAQKVEGAPCGAPSGAVPMPMGTVSVFGGSGFIACNREPGRQQPGTRTDRGLDCRRHILVRLQILLRAFAALAEALAVIGKPRARFLDDAGLSAEVQKLARFGNAVAIHDVELDLAEGRR